MKNESTKKKDTKTRAAPDYLKGYSSAQLRIILDDHPRKQVIAAAGSGKTRTVIGAVTHALLSGREEPGRVLLLSFSRKAAGEIRERLPEELRSLVEVSTFHSFCYRRLGELHPRFRERGMRVLTDEEKHRFYAARLRRHADAIGGVPFDLLIKNPALFRKAFPRIAFAVNRRFHAFKRRAGALEFDDLISLILNGLRKQSDWAATMRARYSLIIVDEFQDTDPRQLEFLRLMEPPRLLVVGDDWQAIYGFRGATVRPFLDLPRHFPGTRKYRLEENYRSTRAVVRLGNQVIRASSRQLRKKVRAVRGAEPCSPVLGLPLEFGGERSLTPLLKGDFMILTRSNFRRDVWRNAGVPAEKVMTIHKAKGLEFPVVLLDLIGGWSGDGYLGLENRRQQKARDDEEIRIAYVGVSRAENLLITLHKPVYREKDREKRLWEKLFEGRVKDVGLEKLGKFLGR